MGGGGFRTGGRRLDNYRDREPPRRRAEPEKCESPRSDILSAHAIFTTVAMRSIAAIFKVHQVLRDSTFCMGGTFHSLVKREPEVMASLFRRRHNDISRRAAQGRRHRYVH